MNWSGLNHVKWKTNLKNLKLKKKFKTSSLNMNISYIIGLNKLFVFFYIPNHWNMLFFKINKKNRIFLTYLYTQEYFFYLPILKYDLSFYYDQRTKVFSFSNVFINNFFFIYWKIFKNVFFSFSKLFFKKLKFRGKGYYIYKNFRNTVATQFGYSHMIRIYGFEISLKFVTKTIIFVYGINFYDILKMSKKIFTKRPHNIFTGKGVRFSKQIIYKKTGKISSYR